MDHPNEIVQTNEPLVSRILTRWNRFPLLLKLVTGVLFFLVVGTTVYAMVVQSGQIALIGQPVPTSVPATPPIPPSPSPLASPATCVSQVYSAEISHACSTQGFYNVSYQCANGQQYRIGDGRTCIDIFAAGQEARSRCGEICHVQVSARPSPVMSSYPSPSPIWPSPIPTSPIPSQRPSPSPTPTIISCVIDVYRLRAGDNDSNGELYMTADRLVTPASVQVLPTDKFVYVPKIRNNTPNKYDLSLSLTSNNVNGDQEPFIIRSSKGNCRIFGNKTLLCAQNNYTVPAGGVGVPFNEMLIEMQPETVKFGNTSTTFTFSGVNRANNKPVQTSCTVLMMTMPVSTPTPQPTVPPGCYLKAPYLCLPALFGRTCDPQVVCPKPSPTPTPTPTPASCHRECRWERFTRKCYQVCE